MQIIIIIFIMIIIFIIIAKLFEYSNHQYEIKKSISEKNKILQECLKELQKAETKLESDYCDENRTEVWFLRKQYEYYRYWGSFLFMSKESWHQEYMAQRKERITEARRLKFGDSD